MLDAPSTSERQPKLTSASYGLNILVFGRCGWLALKHSKQGLSLLEEERTEVDASVEVDFVEAKGRPLGVGLF